MTVQTSRWGIDILYHVKNIQYYWECSLQLDMFWSGVLGPDKKKETNKWAAWCTVVLQVLGSNKSDQGLHLQGVCMFSTGLSQAKNKYVD